MGSSSAMGEKMLFFSVGGLFRMWLTISDKPTEPEGWSYEPVKSCSRTIWPRWVAYRGAPAACMQVASTWEQPSHPLCCLPLLPEFGTRGSSCRWGWAPGGGEPGWCWYGGALPREPLTAVECEWSWHRVNFAIKKKALEVCLSPLLTSFFFFL